MEEMALFVKSMKKFMKKGYKGERSDRMQGSGSKDRAERRRSHQTDDEEDQPVTHVIVDEIHERGMNEGLH